MPYARNVHVSDLAIPIALLLHAVLCTACFDLSDVTAVDASLEGGPDIEAGVDEGGVDEGGVDLPPPFAVGGNIAHLAANGERVFWIEYGTFDAFGNYLQNGALKSKPLAGGPTTTHSSSLAGPTALWVTAGHAFVHLDRWPGPGVVETAFVRVALADGTKVLLVRSGLPEVVAGSDRAYWPAGPHIRSIRDDESEPTIIYTAPEPAQWTWGFVLGDEHLHFGEGFYANGTSLMRRIPIVGGPAETIDIGDPWHFFVTSDERYVFIESDGPENDRKLYLVSLTAGSIPTRVAWLQDLPPGRSFRFMTAFDDRFLVEEHMDRVPYDGLVVHAGDLSPPYAYREMFTVRPFVAEHPARNRQNAQARWAASASGVFHTDGTRIDFVPW